MSTGRFDDTASRERLSALLDGELDRDDVDAACGDWRADSGVRHTWHAWHAIGDALRSDDLACDPQADLRFCAAVRAQLATEAVVLAPAKLATPVAASAFSSLRARWAVGSAVAAGLVLAAGTFALVGPGTAPAPERVALTDASVAPAAGRESSLASVPTEADVSAPLVATIADQKLIRDAQLDRYLVAHKQFAGSSALGVPSTFLRSATVDSASR
ncbi:MAG: sigma-E factor negative regulatory protein [Caldimonas sp.]